MKCAVILLFARLVLGTDETPNGEENAESEKALIKTPVGFVQCTAEQTSSGKKIWSCPNIPYGIAGRFEAPKPYPVSTSDIPINQNVSAICIQAVNILMVLQSDEFTFTDENCLFLHVFVPYDLKISKHNRWPVVFYVFGGGFMSGSAPNHGSFLVEKGVIVVTVNYRLGPLGFLSTGSCDCPGNAGLKDVYAALRWVYANIRDLGGDRNKITGYGTSAGADMISIISADPLACHFFSQIILESGTFVNPWGFLDPTKAIGNAQKLGKKLGCDTSDPQKLCSCLKLLPADLLIETTAELTDDDALMNFDITTFGPTSENPKCANTVLTRSPKDLLLNSSKCKPRIMIIVAQEESCFYRGQIKKNEALLNQLFMSAYKLTPSCLSSTTNELCMDHISKEIKEYYGTNSSVLTTEKAMSLISFNQFIFPFLIYIKYMVESGCKVYLSEFDYSGPCSIGAFTNPEGKLTCHAEGFPYIFPVPLAQTCSLFTSSEKNDGKMVDVITSIYASFATTGYPTLPSGLIWPPYTPRNKLAYLAMGLNLEVKFWFRKSELLFWKSLFDKCFFNDRGILNPNIPKCCSTCPKEYFPYL
uniref:Esterase 3 n=1 Tax=Liposcelis bostrychophila TaxID=185214 RepID=A0A173DWC1_LIPBO|nr:esterase 3 [Liposcelis bostrychophila]